MSYLVCNKCGGYYELQKGENPDDFSGKCECGGSLKYVQNLGDHVVDELDPMEGMNICPTCGEENKVDTNFCRNCGHDLNTEIPESHDGLIKLGYILAVIGPFPLFFIGTIAAILIGIVLYGKKNPKDRRNGKYILITAIIVALIMFILFSLIIPALIIYNSYFNSQSFNPSEDIVRTRNVSRSATYLLNRYL